MTNQPLSDLERFEVVKAMFPDLVPDDSDESWDSIEDIIWDRFEIEPEAFDLLVGHLVTLTPILHSPLSNLQYHVLGTVTEHGIMKAAVHRPVAIQEQTND